MTVLTNTRYRATTVQTIWKRFAILLVRRGRILSRWVTAAITKRDRQAGLPALRHHLNDQELQVAGVFRYRIDDRLAETAQAKMRMQRSERSGKRW